MSTTGPAASRTRADGLDLPKTTLGHTSPRQPSGREHRLGRITEAQTEEALATEKRTGHKEDPDPRATTTRCFNPVLKTTNTATQKKPTALLLVRAAGSRMQSCKRTAPPRPGLFGSWRRHCSGGSCWP